MNDFDKFFAEMSRFVPEEARIMSCQFRGDPNSDIYGKWRARVLKDSSMIDEGANVYLCVSAMKRNGRGEFRRRKENFAGGLLLMIDDIGEGIGAKFPPSVLDPLPPTAMIETSPGNFQAMYFFDKLIEEMETFDALIRAFIARQFLGEDTGQAGVNRVFRPPAGVNGKPKYERDGRSWRVRLADWNPGRRYSVEEIVAAFDLSLVREKRIPRHEGTIATLKGDRIRHFLSVRSALRSGNMIKKEEPDYSGWIHITCPWTGEHSDSADTGAAIRLPAEENEWYGAFRCHHGHCEGKGWRELTEWLSHHQAHWLDVINGNAPDSLRAFRFNNTKEEQK